MGTVEEEETRTTSDSEAPPQMSHMEMPAALPKLPPSQGGEGGGSGILAVLVHGKDI